MNDSSPDNLTFEQALQQLEQIVQHLEDGQTTLEESLASYERGIGLLKRCYGQLRQAEQRILLLSETDAEGKPVLQPFAHTSLEVNKGEGRRLRKMPQD
jgi:exodeoxyribonuclease VII small subunit